MIRCGMLSTLVRTFKDGRDKFDNCLAIIEKVCKNRKQIATNPVTMGNTSEMYMSYPVEVTVGGATVFVLSVDQFIKY